MAYENQAPKGRKYTNDPVGSARLGVRIGSNKMLGDHYLRIKDKGSTLSDILDKLSQGSISQQVALSKIERLKEDLEAQIKNLKTISDTETCSRSKGHTRISGADIKRYAKELLSAINKAIEDNKVEEMLVR